jgi:hypothetical protein
VLVVSRQGRIEPRQVTLGVESADRVEITSGASPGDLLVVGSRAQLKAGTRVAPKVVEPRAAAVEDAR